MQHLIQTERIQAKVISVMDLELIKQRAKNIYVMMYFHYPALMPS
jgi:hypothetical protein